MKFFTLFTITREITTTGYSVTYTVSGWAMFILAYIAAVCAILS